MLSLETKESLISRIASGVKLVGNFLLYPPTPLQKLLGQEVYEEALSEAIWDGVLTHEETVKIMMRLRLWGPEQDESIKKIASDIEHIKVKIFDMQFKSIEQKHTRRLLREAERRLTELTNKRSQFWSVSAEGYAAITKMRFLISQSLHTNDGHLLPESEAYQYVDDVLSETIDRVTEAEYREIARTEPWRSIWGAKHSEVGVFGVAGIHLTDEQKALMVWSAAYDRIFEHPECPSSRVIEDDDALDGWCITQRRKNSGTDLPDINPAIANSEEVFLPADTVEDAARIHEFNDAYGKKMKALNFRKIEQEGTVSHEKLPDFRFKMLDAMNGGK